MKGIEETTIYFIAYISHHFTYSEMRHETNRIYTEMCYLFYLYITLNEFLHISLVYYIY